METPEKSVKFVQSQWPGSGVFIINFVQNSHIVMVFPLLTLNK